MQSVAREVVRYFFRFLLVYWICFMFPFPLDLLGLPLQLVEGENQPAWMQGAGAKYGEGYSWLTTTKNDACKWVGDRVLHVEVINQLTGSGDTMRGYVGCLCAVVISAVAALLWTMLVLLLRPRQPDAHPGGAMVSEKAGTRSGLEQWRPDRHPDRRLYGTVRVLVRFFLCQMLFSYGFAKVIPLQFAQPSSFRLAQQLGDMSPMGLLWTFMGFSAPFQIFTGAVEVLAGILLTGPHDASGRASGAGGDDACFRVEHVLRCARQALFVQLPRDGFFCNCSGPSSAGECGSCSARLSKPGRSSRCSAASTSIVWLWCSGRWSWSGWSLARSAAATSSGTTCMAGRRRQLPAAGIWSRCRLTSKNQTETIR